VDNPRCSYDNDNVVPTGDFVPPELLTIAEAAAWLRVPTWTLRKWRSEGKGPRAAKIGKHLRYRVDELARWYSEQEGRGGDGA
jgi:excisionase family DNA binding protein